MSVVSLSALTLIFGYAVFRYGGVVTEDWYLSIAALGLIAAIQYLAADRTDRPPRTSLPFRLLIAVLLAVVLLQLIPLPLGFVRLLSPMRAELHEALIPVADVSSWTTLTIVPAETRRWLLTLAGFAVAFFFVRELGWRFRERLWILTVPFVGVALLEAVLGLVQYHWGGADLARGTYVNRNHFSGLLEMSLPFAVMAGVSALRTEAHAHRSPAKPAVKACLWFVVAAVILLAIVHSLSRMGFIAALGSLFVMGAAALGGAFSGRRRVLPVLVVAVLVVVGFIFLPTDQLIERFATLAATEEISSDTRAEIWRDTMQLIRVYPVLGCGLGCYESGFYRYKTVAPVHTVDFAHNDYFQLIAELGLIGFAVLLALGAVVVGKALAASSQPAGAEERYLGIACVGSLTAIALHSFVDFNLYIPANALLLVWIAGTTEALGFAAYRPQRRKRRKQTPTYFDSTAAVVR